MKNLVRLQKYLADCQVASRRKSEEYILSGRVKVNQKVVTELGVKINPKKDKVYFDNKLLKEVKKFTYIMLHKPEGCVTTSEEQFNRKTVFDYISNVDARLFSVGRLDFDTSGLLLLTNDGDLTYKLTHPKHNVEKVYYAKIIGQPTKQQVLKFERGLEIDDYKTAPAKIEVNKTEGKFSFVKITIKEGRNRQVRKMCKAIHHPVVSLKRIKIGKLDLGNLKKGQFRHLTREEITYLKSII